MADSYSEIRQRLSDYVLNEADVQDLREMAATMAVRRLDKMFKSAGMQATLQAREDGCMPVVAQMTGEFFRATIPGGPPFVEVGAVVAKGDTIALLEAMKLYNEVLAPVAGTIVEIIEDGSVAEADNVLAWIKPSAEPPAASE